MNELRENIKKLQETVDRPIIVKVLATGKEETIISFNMIGFNVEFDDDYEDGSTFEEKRLEKNIIDYLG